MPEQSEQPKKPRINLQRSLKTHLRWGLAVVVILVGGVGGWAATTEISGAVIAAGMLVVNTNLQDVQHPTGGVVADIMVEEGDAVKEGQVLLRLDATTTRANLAIIAKSLAELSARKARLEAERDDASTLTIENNMSSRYGDESTMSIIAGETRLFELRKIARAGQKEQLRKRIAQYREEISGLEAQGAAKTSEIALINKELEGSRTLFKKGLVPSAKLSLLEREATRLDGEQAQLTATTAQTRGRISEVELQIIQIDRDLSSEVARELRDVDGKIGELIERRVAAEDQLKRIDIRAPQSGVIHQSRVHTIGGVVPAGEVLMQIVPGSDGLAVQARVRPESINQISIRQVASLRFTNFDQRTTPTIDGSVSRIAPDITIDQRSGQGFFDVRIEYTEDQIAKLGDAELVPGMPVEVFFKTNDRDVLSYLIKPLRDQLARAFRES